MEKMKKINFRIKNMEMERQINAISYFYNKTQQEILEEAFNIYWKECFKNNGEELKILMKLNEKNLRENKNKSITNIDNETNLINNEVKKEVIEEAKKFLGINNKFENSKIDNIYQIPNENKK